MVLVRLIGFLLCSVSAFGALAAGTTWEIRASLGASTNGGGFVTGASGTDYSQQDTAQCSATDLTLPTTTTATSATCPFDAQSVGNLIQITAGTNCTTGFYQVVSVATATATLDRVAGTVGCTAGTFSIGGALALPQQACAASVDGNTIYMKASATYTVTTSCTFGNIGGNNRGVSVIGYTTTRGDNGRVTWTTATNNIPLLLTGTIRGFKVYNFNMSNTAGTRAVCIGNNGNIIVTNAFIQNVTFDGCSSGVSFRQLNYGYFFNVEVKNSTGYGMLLGTNSNSSGTGAVLYNVYVHNNSGGGIQSSNQTASHVTLSHCVVASNTGNGVEVIQASGNMGDASLNVVDSVIANNTTNGINFSSGTMSAILTVTNSIIYGNTTNGITMAVAPVAQLAQNVAYGGNGTNRVNFNSSTSDLTLTASPFTNAGTGDYSLNNTAGGGAALRSLGFPGVSLFGTGYNDVGPLQHQSGSGGSSSHSSAYAN